MATNAIIDRYLKIKAECPGCIVLFRIGDFYELYCEDARTASRVLGLTLTTRDRHCTNPIPMAGFPYHQLENYLRRLVTDGYRVAVAELVKEDDAGKVKASGRKVTRIITDEAAEGTER